MKAYKIKRKTFFGLLFLCLLFGQFNGIVQASVFKQAATKLLFRPRPERSVLTVRTDEESKENVKQAMNFVHLSERLACENSELRKALLAENKNRVISIINDLCDKFDSNFSRKNTKVFFLEFYYTPNSKISEVSESRRFWAASDYIIKRLLAV